MKTMINLLIMILGVLPLSLMSQSTVEGYVTYDNVASTPLDNVTVTLQPGGYSTATNSNGYYQITGLQAATYSFTLSSASAYHLANSIDALFILKHFTGITPLTGLRLVAADVNGSGGTPGSVDALTVLKRWVGAIPSFMPPYVTPPGRPDWVFQQPNVVVDGGPASIYTVNIKGLCTGDVNGDAY